MRLPKTILKPNNLRYFDFARKPLRLSPYIQGVSEVFCHCLQQQGIQAVFKSDVTPWSHLVRPKDTLEPTKQNNAVHKIPCECGEVYIS